MDMVWIGLAAVLGVLSWALVALCERLSRGV
jgi:hypothetical protein